METPSSPCCVIIAYDATKVRSEHEFEVTINHVQARGDILRRGGTILVLGVLHKGSHPSKCVTIVESFHMTWWYSVNLYNVKHFTNC